MPPPRPSINAILFTAALGLAPLACTAPSTPAPDVAQAHPPAADAARAVAAEQYPVIVRLAGRHQTITVTAGRGAPLYSAARHDGTPIVAGATLEQLRREHPDLYQHLVPAVASHAESAGSFQDARRPHSADASAEPLMLMSAE